MYTIIAKYCFTQVKDLVHYIKFRYHGYIMLVIKFSENDL